MGGGERSQILDFLLRPRTCRTLLDTFSCPRRARLTNTATSALAWAGVAQHNRQPRAALTYSHAGAREGHRLHAEARLNPMYHSSSLILLPDVCELPAKRQRKRKAPVPAFGPAHTAPPHPVPVSSKGFRQRKSTYRISAAPSGRGRCRRCRAVITNGETRLEVCAFVRPGRYTLLLRCTAPTCIDAPLSAAILSVYKTSDRVPVEAALDGSAEALRVQRTIAAASGGGVNESG